MVDSMSTWSSLEITRNPFESSREERTNCPGFSPSMFCNQETPASQKKRRSFRWSIEQISRLNPADIDEFPNQEYSSTFEREEDEIAAQKAVDEFFSQSSIVPSPWTPNHEAKHVKFSPLPPATAYIEAESSVESSYSSPNSGCKAKADASSQTKLSLPPDFDLQNHLDPAYYNQDGLNGSKDISLSSLRRKLFTQAENNVAKKDQQLLGMPTNIKSILKSPKSPVLVTSSPVSDQSTPKHAMRNRHSTASTMSSPNISPIKPLLSVPETPTSARKVYHSRQSLSPMECSTSVLDSSGIKIIGDALPDLSPIKANARTSCNHIEEMDLANEAKDAENPNNSIDDGGPLEVSELSVKDDNDGDDKEKGNIDDDDDDDEMPPKITMEDLADDLDSTDENSSARSTDSPQMKFEELTPLVKSVPDKAVTEDLDAESTGHEDMAVEEPKFPKDSSMEVEDIGSNYSQEPKSNDHVNEHSRLTKNNASRHPAPSSHRSWQTRDYSTAEGFHKSIHLNELDDDVIMMRAKAALRRANRFSPTKGTSSYSFEPHSLTLSDLSLNVSSAWNPVRMSTPLVPPPGASSRYKNHKEYDSHYGYKSISRSHRHDNVGVTYSEESGLGRSGGDMASHQFHGFSGKRLSPAVEDIIRRRKLQGGFEGQYPLSTSWKKSSSPLFSSKYDSKWQLSHTHPMSYVEWKALYWRPPGDPFTRRENNQYYTSQYGYESDFKRSSWPSRPVSSKMIYGSRPLSPPVTFPPAKVPRAVPGGYVSKIALPSYQDNSDSGYSEWQRSGSRWENTRSQHNSMGYAGEFRYY